MPSTLEPLTSNTLKTLSLENKKTPNSGVETLSIRRSEENIDCANLSPPTSGQQSRPMSVTDESGIFTHQNSIDSDNTTTSNANNQNTPQDTITLPTLPVADQIQNTDFDEEQVPVLNLEDLESGDPVRPGPITAIEDDTSANLRRTATSASNGSYIHDLDHEDVLLNTYTRQRRSSRRSSHPSHVRDTASIEISRMDNQLIQNEAKAKGKAVLPKKPFLDEDRVLVGKEVSEGHQNYVVAYNMLNGIRTAVSRWSRPMEPLTDADYKFIQKLRFDGDGNELAPSSKYDFKFKDYFPAVFRELRMFFGLDPADYLMSLTSKYILSELNSPGKSGSFFYFSRDYRFIIKTIHYAEHRQLRKIIRQYHDHVDKNRNTLISQFYGLHRVKMPLKYGPKRKIYFIVMNNLFPPHRDLHRIYDLKGSTMGRFSPVDAQKQTVLKDNNWIKNSEVIRFGPVKEKVFLDQVKKDVEFLMKSNIMDYSFLIGFHDLNKDQVGDYVYKKKKLSIFSPESSEAHVLANTNPTAIANSDVFSQLGYANQNVFYSDEGGLLGSGPDGEPLEHLYYFGIIDCLTNYSIIKRLETFFRSIRNPRKTISAVPPDEYGRRFYRFVSNSINENHCEDTEKDKDV